MKALHVFQGTGSEDSHAGVTSSRLPDPLGLDLLHEMSIAPTSASG